MKLKMLTAAVALIALAFCLRFAVQGGDSRYAAYSQEWDGYSAFQAQARGLGYQPTILTSSSQLLQRLSGRGVLVIAGPTRGFTVGEIDAIASFVWNGGGLLVTDDFDAGTNLTRVFGLGFAAKPVVDPVRYVKNPNFATAVPVGSHPVLVGVSGLVLNHPSALELTEGLAGLSALRSVAILAVTSPYSWLDENQNERWEVGLEESGPLVIAVAFRYGAGRVVLVSNAAVFDNDMITLGDNLVFAGNVVLWLSDGDPTAPLLLDQTHRSAAAGTAALGSAFSTLSPQLNPASLSLVIVPSVALAMAVGREARERVKPRHSSLSRFTAEYVNLKAAEDYRGAVEFVYKAFKMRLARKLGLPADALWDSILPRLGEERPDLAWAEFQAFVSASERIIPSESLSDTHLHVPDKSYGGFIHVYDSIERWSKELMLHD